MERKMTRDEALDTFRRWTYADVSPIYDPIVRQRRQDRTAARWVLSVFLLYLIWGEPKSKYRLNNRGEKEQLI